MKSFSEVSKFVAECERFPDDDSLTYKGMRDALKMAYQWIKAGVIDEKTFIYMMTLIMK